MLTEREEADDDEDDVEEAEDERVRIVFSVRRLSGTTTLEANFLGERELACGVRGR